MNPQSSPVTERLISAVIDLAGQGRVDEAAGMVRLLNRQEPADVREALLFAAVAPDPATAAGILARAITEAPGDRRLPLALGSANAWLNDRVDRQAFALSCVAHLVPDATPH